MWVLCPLGTRRKRTADCPSSAQLSPLSEHEGMQLHLEPSETCALPRSSWWHVDQQKTPYKLRQAVPCCHSAAPFSQSDEEGCTGWQIFTGFMSLNMPQRAAKQRPNQCHFRPASMRVPSDTASPRALQTLVQRQGRARCCTEVLPLCPSLWAAAPRLWAWHGGTPCLPQHSLSQQHSGPLPAWLPAPGPKPAPSSLRGTSLHPESAPGPLPSPTHVPPPAGTVERGAGCWCPLRRSATTRGLFSLGFCVLHGLCDGCMGAACCAKALCVGE